jgi:hypothetical protein
MYLSKNLILTLLIKPSQELISFFYSADATFGQKAVSTPLKAQNLYLKFSNISKSL